MSNRTAGKSTLTRADRRKLNKLIGALPEQMRPGAREWIESLRVCNACSAQSPRPSGDVASVALAEVTPEAVAECIHTGLKRGDPRMLRLWSEWQSRVEAMAPTEIRLVLHPDAERLLLEESARPGDQLRGPLERSGDTEGL
ncbi:MAG TPA: hypothetical protein VGS41_19330 [Chthonomonadales bacterium]|nr:hypothetical protein [Chthonomonadales bacterium]